LQWWIEYYGPFYNRDLDLDKGEEKKGEKRGGEEVGERERKRGERIGSY
jgi:hypothetical protein